MSTSSGPTTDASTLARRRRLLYAAAGLALLLVGVVALLTLLRSGDDTPDDKRPQLATPVILTRVKLTPPDGGQARGLAELLRREEKESLRVLATRLKPSAKDNWYQLQLAGGKAPARLLGSAVVGDQRVFVGESKLAISELERHTRVELRRVTRSGGDTLVLRGRIPR